MADLPFPITAQSVSDLIQQTKLLMDDLYNDRIGGALLGDVFEIGVDDILALKLSAAGGLEKSSNQLQIKNKTTGGLTSSSDGEYVKCKTGGGLATDVDGLYVTAAMYSFGTIACPAGTNPVADMGGDTLTLIAGTGITITGDAVADSVTIAAHAQSHSITSTSDHTSTATSGRMLKANANGLPVDATNTDAEVAAAVTASHAAVTLSVAADLILSLSTQQIGLDNQTANTVLAGPSSGAAAAPSFRALVADDVPVIPATKVELAEIGTATYDDLQDVANVTISSGYVSGGVISDNGLGGINISQLEGFIKSSDSAIGITKFFTLIAGSILSAALSDNDCNYIYVDYNAGAPAFATTTDRSTIKTTNQFPLGRVYKVGTDIEILQSGIQIQNYIRRNHERLVSRGNMERMSGSVISETGTRQVYCTAGVWYIGSNRLDMAVFNSSVTNFDHYYYYTGAAWAEVAATGTIDNTQYNNVASGLATLTANRYGVHWIYQCYEGELSVVFGQGDYTLSQAQASQAPGTLPDYLSSFAVLIGRIIIKKSASSFTSIESAFTTLFIPEAVTTHNNLAGIQGGTTAEYYHLTSAQHGYLNDANAQLEALQTDGSPVFVTVKLSGLTDGKIPYHVDDATGLADGPTKTDVDSAVSLKHAAVTAGGNISLSGQEVSVAPGTSSELTISSGSVTVSGTVALRRHTVDTEGDAATDDLTTISGGNIGEILIISAANDARTVVVKQGTGLLIQADFSLDSIDDMMMLECKSANVWREISRANNG